MKPSSDKKYQARARIGVVASVGMIIGALVGEIFYDTSTAKLIWILIGTVIGGAIGSRMRSQSFQFIWIEYSRQVAVRMLVSGVLFTGFMLAFFYATESSDSSALQLALLVGTLSSMFFMAHALKFAISELDDVLINVQKEAAVVGLIVAVCTFFILGMVNQITPIPSHWLFSFIIVMASFLVGRFYVGWKYR
jgi:hypothetical protein